MRKSWDVHLMNIAAEVASMGTCARRQVGCVLIDDRNVILATGMNGVPPKFSHCRDNPQAKCPGADALSGTNLDGCLANHAEANALLHCADVMKAKVCYTTSSPCMGCVKMLLCTGVKRVVFLEEYPHEDAKLLWTRKPLALSNGDYEPRTWEMLKNGATILKASSSLRT